MALRLRLSPLPIPHNGTAVTLLRHRVPTPAGDYAGILNAVAELVAFTERETGQTGTVGIATPGAISPTTGLLKNSNSTVLNGKPLDRDLEARLGRPIRMENDANCFALSEAVDGAAANARVVFGVILGTGVGGGIVVNRQVHVGRNKIAGEWGHNPLPWARADELPGAVCYCGKRGCIETFLSGAGLMRDYLRTQRPTEDGRCNCRSRRGRRFAGQRVSRHLSATGWRGVWLLSSMCLILTRLCLGVDSPT